MTDKINGFPTRELAEEAAKELRSKLKSDSQVRVLQSWKGGFKLEVKLANSALRDQMSAKSLTDSGEKR